LDEVQAARTPILRYTKEEAVKRETVMS
jgi:glycine dehydrogenase subunit 2